MGEKYTDSNLFFVLMVNSDISPGYWHRWWVILRPGRFQKHYETFCFFHKVEFIFCFDGKLKYFARLLALMVRNLKGRSLSETLYNLLFFPHY